MVGLDLDWSRDLNLARVEVWEKLDRIRRDLPEDIEDITVDNSWHSRESDDPILEARLSSNLDLSESYDLLDRRIVKPLQRVPGVAQVRLDGVNPREVRINLRLADLERHNIDLREVSAVLRGSNFNESLGKVTEGETRFVLRTVGSFKTVDEIRDLVLRADGLRLRNVADVVYEEPPLEYGRHLDGKFAIGLTISAEAKANSVEVCERLEERIAEMNDEPELRGVSCLIRHNEGKEIKKTIRGLLYTGLFGASLASIVLLAFLRRISTTLVSVLTIPFSLIVTCGIVWTLGSTMNTMTLLGLIVGVGMLVDNAVVVIENIFRYQELGYDRKDAARLGAREVSVAVIAATLTSVIVFLPIVFNKPTRMNIQFREIGITVCLTLLASLFVSQTLIPLATSWAIRSKPRPRETWMVWLESLYVRVLRFNLHHRWLTPIVAIAIAASAVYPFRQVDINFDTTKPRLYVHISYRFSEPLPLEKKEEVISFVESRIEPHRKELGAAYIYSYWRDRFALTRVYLHEGDATPENMAHVRTVLKKHLPEIPGLKLEIAQRRKFWRRDSGKRVAFQLFGEDSEILVELAVEARRRLETIDGLTEHFVSDEEGNEELHVEPRRDLLAQYDVTPDQLAQRVGLTFRGRRLRRFRTDDGEREMRLTLEEQKNETTSQLHNLPMWTRDGTKVPLAALADFRVIDGPQRIERENRLTSVWVGAKYTKGTREEYVPKVEEALASMQFPYGYSWTFGSWRARQREQHREFLVNLSLALILVFAVMAGIFESVQRAIALMVSLPFALTGAIWTLSLTETGFDQPAAVGVILLIGIVVNNGIVLIEHMSSYQRQGMAREDAMVKGGTERLRPILMTALTTLIGLVPIVVQQPALGDMYYYSMALVIMGGLAASTFLTCLLLPTTVTLVEDATTYLSRLLRFAKAHDS